jgi:hypothetical protein
LAGVTVKVIFQDIRKIESDAIVVGCFEDVRPLKGFAGQLDWLLCGSLSSLLLTSRIRGALGDVALLTSRGKIPSPKIFMMGLGRRSGFSLTALRDAARTAAASVLGAGAAQVVIEYLLPPDTAPENGIPAVREGLKAGAGGRSLTVSLLAPDREIYEKLSGTLKA